MSISKALMFFADLLRRSPLGVGLIEYFFVDICVVLYKVDVVITPDQITP